MHTTHYIQQVVTSVLSEEKLIRLNQVIKVSFHQAIKKLMKVPLNLKQSFSSRWGLMDYDQESRRFTNRNQAIKASFHNQTS